MHPPQAIEKLTLYGGKAGDVNARFRQICEAERGRRNGQALHSSEITAELFHLPRTLLAQPVS